MGFRKSYAKFIHHPVTLGSGFALSIVLGVFGICYPMGEWIKSRREEKLALVKKQFEIQTQKILEQYDQDKSGFLDMGETEIVYNEELVNSILRKFDYNKNGVLDGTEPAFYVALSDMQSLSWQDFSQKWGDSLELFSRESGGSWRLCEDYRKILDKTDDQNKGTEKHGK